MEKRNNFLVSVIGIFMVLMFLSFCSGQNFDVDSALFKISLKQGDSITKSLKISSGNQGGLYSLSVVAVKGVKLSEESFDLPSGESRSINVIFDTKNLEAGAYIGSILINGPKENEVIPVLFEVETKEVIFDAALDIPPAYTDIEQGSKLIAQVKLFDLTAVGGTQTGLGAVPVDLDYVIYDFDGGVLVSESERAVVEGRAQFTRATTFPKGVKPGDYVLTVTAHYEQSIGVSSQMFSIGSSKNNVFSFGSIFSSGGVVVFASILFGIVFLSILFFLVYIMRGRDKLIIELKKYNAQELRQQREFLLEQAKLLNKKSSFVKEKPRKIKREIKKEIKKKVLKLKKVHEHRVKEFKRLKKSGNELEMKRKLVLWKREGYNTLPLEYKLRGLSNNEMSSLLKKWKSQYSQRKN